jgi:hypothetical protein
LTEKEAFCPHVEPMSPVKKGSMKKHEKVANVKKVENVEC